MTKGALAQKFSNIVHKTKHTCQICKNYTVPLYLSYMQYQCFKTATRPQMELHHVWKISSYFTQAFPKDVIYANKAPSFIAQCKYSS